MHLCIQAYWIPAAANWSSCHSNGIRVASHECRAAYAYELSQWLAPKFGAEASNAACFLWLNEYRAMQAVLTIADHGD